MNQRLLPAVLPLLLAATAALPGAVAFAADPPTPATAKASAPAAAPQIDDTAMALLQKEQTTMMGLETYRAEAMMKVTLTAPGLQPRPATYQRETAIAEKPGQMRYEQWTATVDAQGAWVQRSKIPNAVTVSDGKTVWQQFGRSYTTKPYTSPRQIANAAAPWEGFFSENVSPYADASNEKRRGELLELRGMGSEDVDGISCQKVFVHSKPPQGKDGDIQVTWFIGPDNLVHRKTETVLSGKITRMRDTTVRHIQTNAPVTDGATLFAYTPPTGVTPLVPKQEPVLLASGVAAPEITAVDKNGKTVKLSDFKGKVVVVDFWASWCPPCKASMPHNQEVTKKLQDANVPMVLLAVDNSEEQPGFAKWVKEHPELSSLQFVYADPKTRQVCGEDYHVSGIPTQYIIDAQGMIRASFVGYGGPTDDMEKAVRAAMLPMPATKTAAR